MTNKNAQSFFKSFISKLLQWGSLFIISSCATESFQRSSSSMPIESSEQDIDKIAQEVNQGKGANEDFYIENGEIEAIQMNKSSLEKAIKMHAPKFKECYLKEIKSSPYGSKKGEKRVGSLILAFTLKANGQLQRVGVEENEFPLELKACLLEALWKVKFSPLKGPFNELKVRLPLYFSLDD